MKTVNHDSSMLDTSSYNSETGELVVTFKGGQAYRYENVLTEDYQNFIDGESAGKAFNQFIKPNYSSSKLEPLNETETRG